MIEYKHNFIPIISIESLSSLYDALQARNGQFINHFRDQVLNGERSTSFDHLGKTVRVDGETGDSSDYRWVRVSVEESGVPEESYMIDEKGIYMIIIYSKQQPELTTGIDVSTYNRALVLSPEVNTDAEGYGPEYIENFYDKVEGLFNWVKTAKENASPVSDNRR